jgi:hypothetical protein
LTVEREAESITANTFVSRALQLWHMLVARSLLAERFGLSKEACAA